MYVYAAVIVYKQSGKPYVYVVCATSEGEALNVATAATGRSSAIDARASYAKAWPAGAPCPRTDSIMARGTPYAFKLQSPAYADATLAALGHGERASAPPLLPLHVHRPAPQRPGGGYRV